MRAGLRPRLTAPSTLRRLVCHVRTIASPAIESVQCLEPTRPITSVLVLLHQRVDQDVRGKYIIVDSKLKDGIYLPKVRRAAVAAERS
jgi:hypothetical protein